MKKTIAILITILFAQISSQAQTFSQTLISKIPAGILEKIFINYTSKIQLSEKTQMQLAERYLKNDSILFSYLQSKRTVEEVQILKDSLNLIIEKDIPVFFSKEESGEFKSRIADKRKYAAPIINNIIYPQLEMNTPIGYALTKREDMRLRSTQTDSLISFLIICGNKEKLSEQSPDSGYFDKDAFQSDALTKILTQKQHAALLSVMYADDSKKDARFAWHDLVAYKLSDTLDKEKTIRQLTAYFLSQRVVNDLTAYDRGKQRVAMQMMRAPEYLQKLNEAKMSNEMKMEKYNQ